MFVGGFRLVDGIPMALEDVAARENAFVMPLLSAKPRIPSVPDNYLSRSRLYNQLDDFRRHALNVVVAPAGYGKTSLVASWIRRTRHTAAWLTLCAEDTDPRRFWSCLNRSIALATDNPLICGLPVPDDVWFGENIRSKGIDLLLATLDGLIEPLTIVLDDFQTVSQNRGITQDLAYFIDGLPENANIIVLSRSIPPLRLSRRRLEGALGELLIDDLAFTPQEAFALFSQYRQPISKDFVKGLVEQNEGCPAVFGLLLSELQKQCVTSITEDLPADFIESLDAYFLEEILDPLPQNVQDFMVMTSTLESFSPSLAGYLLKRQPQHEPFATTLETIEWLLANGILVCAEPEADDELWYCYPKLLRHALLQKAKRKGLSFMRDSRRAAGEWFLAEGKIDEAAFYAALARDYDVIRDIILRSWREKFEGDDLSTLLRWFSSLPEEYIAAYPKLCLFETLPLATSGDFATARKRFDQVKRSSKKKSDLYDATADALYSLVRSIEGDFDESRMAAQRALDKLPEDETHFRAMLYQTLCGATPAYDIIASYQMLQRAEAMTTSSSDKTVLCSLYSNFARVEARIGMCTQALEHVHQARELYRSEQDRMAPMLTFALVAESLVCYQRGEYEQAAEACDQTLRNSHVNYMPRNVASIKTVQASILARIGRQDESNQRIGQAVRLDINGVTDVFPGMVHLRAWAPLLGSGHVLEQQAKEGSHPVNVSKQWFSLALSFVRGDEVAVKSAEALKDSTDASFILGKLHAYLLLSCLHEREGDFETSAFALMKALDIARPERIVQPFLDAAPFISKGLKALARREQDGFASHVHKLLPGVAIPVKSPGPKSRLSPREIDIMKLLDTGLSTAQIAEQLFISPETAKKHLFHIYRKLDAHSRFQALAQFKASELLQGNTG
jgi:LuxR family maltose regulon positive regulatory protein